MTHYKPYTQQEALRLAQYICQTIEGSRIMETTNGYNIVADDRLHPTKLRIYHVIEYVRPGDNPNPQRRDQWLRQVRAGHALQLALRDAGIAPTALSKQLFDDSVTVHGILHGKHPVTVDQLIFIADAAGLELKFVKKE